MPPAESMDMVHLGTTESGENFPQNSMKTAAQGSCATPLTSIGYQPNPFILGMLLYLIIKPLSHEFKKLTWQSPNYPILDEIYILWTLVHLHSFSFKTSFKLAYRKMSNQ